MKILFFLFLGVLVLPSVLAAASFSVSNLACTPGESTLGSSFSCTATVQNAGDAAGTVGTVTLYPDSNSWLENSNYPKTVSQSVNAGESVEVTFSGLNAVKSGTYGFSEVRIDNAGDTSSTVTGVSVNIVDVAVTVSSSKSSAASGVSFTASAEITAGGSIDSTLTFAVNSGGCSIGNEDSTKTISGMSHGSKQSRTWTVTMGTSGNCVYTITASGTGSGGSASATDSTQTSVSCTDCSSGSSSSSSSTSSGGSSSSSAVGTGGVSGGTLVNTLGELSSERTIELGRDEKINFNVNGQKHTLKINNLTNIDALISVQSELQVFTLGVGDSIKISVENDDQPELKVYLKSINIIKNKATLVLTPLYTPSEGIGDAGEKKSSDEEANTANKIPNIIKNNSLSIFAVIIAIIVLFYVVRLIKRMPPHFSFRDKILSRKVHISRGRDIVVK